MPKNMKKRIFIVIKYIFLTLTALCFLMPVIFMVANSFMHGDEIMTRYLSVNNDDFYNVSLIPDRVTAYQYYMVLFRSPDYLRQFWNSVILTLPTVAFQILISFFAAYAFAKIKFPGRNIIFSIILILMLLPIQVTLVPNFMVLNSLNLLNKHSGIILAGIFAPFAVCFLSQYLRYIPDDGIEAAKIDGAGEMQIIFKIIFSQAKAGIAAVAILSFVDNWNMIEQPLLFLDKTEMQPLSVLVGSFSQANLGIAFAAGMLFMIPALIIFLMGQEYIIEGIKLYRSK